MQRQVYADVGALLAPATLAQLTGLPVIDVQCTPVSMAGMSGADLSRVTLVDEAGGPLERRLILKRMALESNFHMVATEDWHCRAAALWEYGIYDALPAQVDHAVIACACDGEGWAILMHDVGAALLSPKTAATRPEMESVIAALAAMHAAFWESDQLKQETLGLCDLYRLTNSMRPSACLRLAPAMEKALPGGDWITLCRRAWEELGRLMPVDAYRFMCQLRDDPKPLAAALEELPHTLVHGDYRNDNLGLHRAGAPRVIVLDWGWAARSVATVDLAWFIYGMPPIKLNPHLSAQAVVSCYRSALAQAGIVIRDGQWDKMMDLGFLVNAMRLAPMAGMLMVQNDDPVVQKMVSEVLPDFAEDVRCGVCWL